MLQALIAACHAVAFRPEDTDWQRIATLYAILARVYAFAGRGAEPGGRGVHGPMARRPGWTWSISWRASPRSRSYHLLPSVRGDLLEKLGRTEEAQAEFERAAALARNERERQLAAARARAAGYGLTCSAATANSRNREQFCLRSAGAYAIIIRRTGQRGLLLSQSKWGRNGV